MNKIKNFLIIQVDQLTDRALKAYGGKMPHENIDRMFSNGIKFDDCTCQFPLCQPSRASLWSGLYPHETKVLSNGKNFPVDDIKDDVPTLGSLFKDAGYKCVHFGKKHDAGALRGFECEEFAQLNVENISPYIYNQDTFHDAYTSEKANEFISSYDWKQPLLMVVDFVNPHNICAYVGDNKDKHFEGDVSKLPELPENFEFDDILNRSVAIQYICCSHNRQAQASKWLPNDYRAYLAAYHHYLDIVDKQIGTLLDTLKNSAGYEDTLIMFFSDHGDGMAARGSVTKQVAMYHETVNVPLFIGGKPFENMKGMTIEGLAENLDVVPTLLDFAGIAKPKTMGGISLKSAIESAKIDREYAVSEWHTEWGFTISPGRMIRTKDFRYTHFIEDGKEELYDLKKDPFEKKNVADNPEYEYALKYHRDLLKKHLENTNDNYFSLEAMADKRWRSHTPGYHNHEGIAAPQA